MGEFSHPLLAVREVRKRAVILIAADKGLCGALNSNVFRLVAEFDPQSTVFVTAGRKAAQFIARTHRQLLAEFAYADTPKFAEARAIATFARDLFLKKEVDEVRVVGTRFVNTLTQQPLSLEFLPVGQIKTMNIAGIKAVEEEIAGDVTESLFEPSPEFVLSYLLSHYLDIYIYQVLLNAKASEQSARMVSMKNATESAEGLIKDLKLEYNKLRQGNITKELLEIAGGQSD
jgi:F-type H+-transporting ATPase subunit gamma